MFLKACIAQLVDNEQTKQRLHPAPVLLKMIIVQKKVTTS
jgi:hypothetical protein